MDHKKVITTLLSGVLLISSEALQKQSIKSYAGKLNFNCIITMRGFTNVINTCSGMGSNLKFIDVVTP
ncbi:hypothetical protein [Paenibacillus taichungensis]|uniref:hypothetical protein n=1 Tax=Paenibacillus taichungensis TaxID=484184 RepID=UPI0039A6577C